MRVPHTIDKNTLTVYAPPERITLSDDEYHSDSDDVEEEEIEEEEEEEEDEKLLGRDRNIDIDFLAVFFFNNTFFKYFIFERFKYNNSQVS
jgi:hypothetical protein